MAFAKTTWVDGSAPAITAAQLNRVEQGIADAHAGNIDAGAIGTNELANNAVTNAKLRDSTALSVIGRSANSTGDPADIAVATDGHVLRRSGTSLAFGQVATAGIADAAVTNAKVASGLDASKLTTGTLPSARIADGGVTSVKLAAGTNEALWVGARLADVGYLGIGTFALLKNTSPSGTGTGSTRAGSSLVFCDVDGNASPGLQPSGTWRCHGYSASQGQATLWQRIA